METASNPFDELTSLYLGEVETEAEDETTAGAADASREDSDRSMVVPGRHAVTIALCGHLPVMAGLWVTQYADRLAAEVGPTGLVRLEGGRCILEVLRPGAELAERIESRPQGDLVEQVSQLASSGIRRWIVCVDDRDAASAVRAGADEVVILTAPDKPAVIEAFRLAKTASARVVDPSLLDLGLVLVGTDDEWADALANRLSRVSSRMLDRELPVRGTVKRIDVVEGSVRRMFAEAARAPFYEVVESIIESLSVAEAAELEVGDRRSSRPVEDEPPSLRLADEFGGHPVRPIRIAPAAATASEPSDAESVPASFPTPTPTPTSTPVPAPEPELEEVDPDDSIDPELLAHPPVGHRLPARGLVLPVEHEAGIEDVDPLHVLGDPATQVEADHGDDAGILVHHHHVGVDDDGDGRVAESVVLREDLDLLLPLDVLADDTRHPEDLAATHHRDGTQDEHARQDARDHRGRSGSGHGSIHSRAVSGSGLRGALDGRRSSIPRRGAAVRAPASRLVAPPCPRERERGWIRSRR